MRSFEVGYSEMLKISTNKNNENGKIFTVRKQRNSTLARDMVEEPSVFTYSRKNGNAAKRCRKFCGNKSLYFGGENGTFAITLCLED